MSHAPVAEPHIPKNLFSAVPLQEFSLPLEEPDSCVLKQPRFFLSLAKEKVYQHIFDHLLRGDHIFYSHDHIIPDLFYKDTAQPNISSKC